MEEFDGVPSGEIKAYFIPNGDVYEVNGVITVDPFDRKPFYLDEPKQVKDSRYTERYKLHFEDSPSAPYGWFSQLGMPSTTFQLAVGMVGYHFELKQWSTLHMWSSKKEYPATSNNQLSTIFVTKRTNIPADYSSWPGTNDFEGLINSNLYPTPTLVGKNIDRDIDEINSYLINSGFTVEVQTSIASDTIPKGQIISQNPVEDVALASPQPIKVTISKGPAKACGNIPSGQTTTRTRYKNSIVPFGTTCDSVKEIQIGTCIDGDLAFSGSAQFDSCVIGPKPTECMKTTKLKCKAGIFQLKECQLPKNVVSVKRDEKYKGSSCHIAPRQIKTLWDALKIINSYSIENDHIRSNIGCDIQFDVSYKDNCSK